MTSLSKLTRSLDSVYIKQSQLFVVVCAFDDPDRVEFVMGHALSLALVAGMTTAILIVLFTLWHIGELTINETEFSINREVRTFKILHWKRITPILASLSKTKELR